MQRLMKKYSRALKSYASSYDSDLLQINIKKVVILFQIILTLAI
jgi:hypothetical protein